MQFSTIYGREELWQSLVRMVDQDRLGHALLFVEEEGMGALAYALALAQYVNCTGEKQGDSCGKCLSCHKYSRLIHPDLHFVFPVAAAPFLSDKEKKAPISDHFIDRWRKMVLENPYFNLQQHNDALGIDSKSGLITVNEAKKIFEKLSLTSCEGEYKTMIIWLPEKMNAEASNKLLKLLEEPPQGTLFLLVSQHPDKLLTTILSRCQIIRLLPMEQRPLAQALEDNLGIGAEDAAMLARISGGRYGRACRIQQLQEEGDEFEQPVLDMFDAGLRHSLSDIMAVWEPLSSLGREKQKEFCIYCENYRRKRYMFACGVREISQARQKEYENMASLAAKLKPSFYEKAVLALDTALSSIEANVSPKLIFCDLFNRLSIYM